MLAASVVFLVVGFGVLLYSGDCLVRGALAAALKMQISPLLTGILIVGFGTSVPEFLISIQSAQAGATGLADGNIIGSNIADIWLVLALPAAIFPVVTTAPRMRLTALVMLAATLAWIVATAFIGLTTLVGFVFLGALAVYAIIAFTLSRRDVSEEVDTPEERKLQRMHSWKMVLLILIGVVGLPLGSRLLIDGGIAIAKVTPLSEEAVGLVVLGVGSSLPELGAGLAAAWRKESDVAMGNILGSNIFNILGAGGVIALIRPHQLAPIFHDWSHWAMAAAALSITLIAFIERRIGWLTSVFFLGLYVLYIFGLVEHWSVGNLHDLITHQPLAPAAPGALATPPPSQ